MGRDWRKKWRREEEGGREGERESDEKNKKMVNPRVGQPPPPTHTHLKSGTH